MEVDEQDREQVDSGRESRGAKSDKKKTKQEQATNAQTCDGMCRRGFVRHAL